MPLYLNGWTSLFLGMLFLGTFGTDIARVYYLSTRKKIPAVIGTKSALWERVSGAVSLYALTGIALLSTAALPSWIVAVLMVALLAVCFLKIEFLLSLLAHLCKIAFLMAILALSGIGNPELTSLIAPLTIGLGIEGLPISWQGLGLGHVAFAKLLAQSGVEIYSLYFIGKVAFKLIGGLLLIHESRKS
jgi:hypothetical protein